MKNNSNFIFDYIYSLHDKIHGLREELSTFTDPEKFKDLSDWDLEQQYKNIKRMMGIYQEERIRRKVVSELKIKTSKLGDQSSIFHNQPDTANDEDLEEFNNFKKKFNDQIQEKVNELIEMQSEYDIEGYVGDSISKLTEYIDSIYENSFLIQKLIRSENNKVKKRFHVLENKIETLNDVINRFTVKKGEDVENERGYGVNKSFDDIVLKRKIPKSSDENDEDENNFFFMYKGLAAKLNNFSSYVNAYEELQNYKRDDLKTQIYNNLDAGNEPLHNIDLSRREIPQSRRETNIDSVSKYQIETDQETEQIRESDFTTENYEKNVYDDNINNRMTKVFEKFGIMQKKPSQENMFTKPYRDDSPDFIQREDEGKEYATEQRDIEFDADISQVPHSNQKSFVSDTREAIAMFKINSMKRESPFAPSMPKADKLEESEDIDVIEIEDQASLDSTGMRPEPDLIPRQPINIIPKYEKPSVTSKIKNAMNKAPAFSSKLNSGDYKERLSPLKSKQSPVTNGYSSKLKKR